MTNLQLSKLLGYGFVSTRTKCYELGLKRFPVYYWTPAQVRFLRQNYGRMGDVEIAEIFNRIFTDKERWTKKHIDKKRTYLKLFRTAKQSAAVKKRNVRQGRFSINHWRRWFGKSAPVGEIRIWMTERGVPNKFIKRPHGWIPYGRYLYQQTFGAIPRGMIVTTRDGNPLHITPENLELLKRSDVGTILRRSDRYAAAMMSFKDPQLRKELLLHPEILRAKKLQFQLLKEIQSHEE